MVKYITADRLAEAVTTLGAFKANVNPQGLQHILPFLALRRKGVNSTSETRYEEDDDYAFWNTYFEVDPKSTAGRYYDPFAGARRIASHPHSNVATARKGTFASSWSAARVRQNEDGHTLWQLDEKYLEKIQQKSLTKGGSDPVLIPAVDLVVWMQRLHTWPDDATPDSLIDWFKAEFRLSDAEFDGLFQAHAPVGQQATGTGPAPQQGVAGAD